MAFQEGIETLICRQCGAEHKARWYRLPVKEPYSVRCRACRAILAEGNGTLDYFEIELVKR